MYWKLPSGEVDPTVCVITLPAPSKVTTPTKPTGCTVADVVVDVPVPVVVAPRVEGTDTKPFPIRA